MKITHFANATFNLNLHNTSTWRKQVRWFAWEVNDNMDTAAEAEKPAGFSPFDYEHEHEHDYEHEYE